MERHLCAYGGGGRRGPMLTTDIYSPGRMENIAGWGTISSRSCGASTLTTREQHPAQGYEACLARFLRILNHVQPLQVYMGNTKALDASMNLNLY